MKLYAQHGHGDGQKSVTGLAQSLIDGLIFSPKDISAERLRAVGKEIRSAHPSADVLFDPQFYATILAVDPASNLGSLDEDYADYFKARRRSQLLSEKQLLGDLDAVLQFQRGLPVTAVIAPNILIPRSCDSTEAAIAMDFIRNTRRRHDQMGGCLPVYATLALGHEALIQREDLQRFLNDLTVLDERPDGFYLLVAVNNMDARSDLFHADVIAGWMLINHVLTVNGYHVVNGYSDLLSPFLGVAGAAASATGWWSNLRSFSTGRFGPPSGGRLPVERYLSCLLLNRIAFYELESLRNTMPNVLNGLPTDDLYSAEQSSQPRRNQEVLQSWDAIRKLSKHLITTDIVGSLGKCLAAVEQARKTYDSISVNMELDTKSNSQHLEPLEEGIRLFAELAELQLP